MLPVSPTVALVELTLALAVGAALEHWLTARLVRPLDGEPAHGWLWEHLGAPLLAAATLVCAALLAYPALFGLREAIGLDQLVFADPRRFGTVLGVVFLCGAIAARVPPLARRAPAVHTVQGFIAVGWLFNWFRDELGAVSASAWPGTGAGIALLVLGLLVPRLALGLGREFGLLLESRLRVNGLAVAAGGLYACIAIAALLTLYGYLLGQQVGI